jgi:hypothetical protein
MEILITRELTRSERVLLYEQAIKETEKKGHGYVLIKIHNHQITDVDKLEGTRFGNCSQEWYEA